MQFRGAGESGIDEKTEQLAEAVIGAAIEVHRHLGPGLPEVVYRNALAYEMELRGIDCATEVPVPVIYKGRVVGEGRLDLLVGGSLILELKVVEALSATHRAQVIAYLQAKKLQLGILINFNVALLKDGIKRVINTHS